jgi:hypothetical protein
MALGPRPEKAHPLMLLFDRPQGDLERLLVDKFQKLLRGKNDHPILQKAKFEHRFVDVPTEIPTENIIFYEAPFDALSSALEIYNKIQIPSKHHPKPIMQACLSEAAAFGSYLGAAAIYWKPAKIVSGFGFFDKSLTDFENGGAFPILSTVHFEIGAVGIVRTSGLAWFCEQELEFRYTDLAVAKAMHRCVRLAHDMILNGRFVRIETVPGLDRDEILDISPSDDLSLVRVKRKSPSVKWNG